MTQGRQGTATGTVYQSPARAKRKRRQRAAEDRAWAALAGPVTVTRREPTLDAASLPENVSPGR